MRPYIHPHTIHTTTIHICILINVHTTIHTSIHPHVHTSIHTFIQPCLHVTIHSYIHISKHPSVHSSIHPYMHTSIHALYPYMHISINAYIHKCIHPQVHTSIHAFIHTYVQTTYICLHAHSHTQSEHVLQWLTPLHYVQVGTQSVGKPFGLRVRDFLHFTQYINIGIHWCSSRLLPYVNFVENSDPLEAKSRSSLQQTLCTLSNPKRRWGVHEDLLLVSRVSHMNPVYSLT
jgi:hypothetical protein